MHVTWSVRCALFVEPHGFGDGEKQTALCNDATPSPPDLSTTWNRPWPDEPVSDFKLMRCGVLTHPLQGFGAGPCVCMQMGPGSISPIHARPSLMPADNFFSPNRHQQVRCGCGRPSAMPQQAAYPLDKFTRRLSTGPSYLSIIPAFSAR